MKTFHFLILISIILLFTGSSVSETLDDVRKRGFVKVGVNGDVLGFSKKDKKGVWRGLDVDTGRAIAAAVFGDAKKIEFLPLSTAERFSALQSGKVDVLCRNATRTLRRETSLDFNFVQVNFYDGQGFLVPKKKGIKSIKDFHLAKICVIPDTTSEVNVTDYFKSKGIPIKLVRLYDNTRLVNAFFEGKCDCLTSDASQLAAHRASAKNPGDYEILPDIISKEPLAPAVRHGNDEWLDIVNFTILALINAEELHINSKNVDQMLKSKKPKIQRFLGVIPGNGDSLGLDEKFAYHIIKQVGNYEEIFERNVGKGTPLGLRRGLNALWYQGGLMLSPPFK